MKKVDRALNYIEHLLIPISTVSGYLSISAFASLVGIPIGITSSAVGLKICEITARIQKYKSLRKDRRNYYCLHRFKYYSQWIRVDKQCTEIIWWY